MIHVDPMEAFPGQDQAERRIRFRDNPHAEFLRCTDDEQSRISAILMNSLGPAIVELAVMFEEDTRREIGA
ncbi:hypothetical protein [Rhizobium azibense]|uniref:hypothetical protein n=1 Tax=Rhizobium azibense TaxID=1136135 RepID=UPI001044CECB|nr:hypothetical protein [Rhizobium azibense]